MTTMQDTIGQVKADFLRARADMERALAETPDDRINWSPSLTSRTPLAIAAHMAFTVKSINEMMDGTPYPAETTAIADKEFLDWERHFTTREKVLALLDANSSAYIAWLDALTPEQFESTVRAPFNLGSVPVSVAIAFPAGQLRWHTAQIHYIQTIYGDRDWHL